jgi:hypothetical protein
MPVRIWCVMAIVLLVVIIYFTISQILAGAAERAMILNGIPVTADIVQLSGTTNPDAAFHRNEPLATKLRYMLPGEDKPRLESGQLSILSDHESVIHPGDQIALRVDRNDPDHWTDRTEPRSWFVELSVVAILLPMVVLLLVIAALQRARILRIWRSGEAAPVTVVEVRQTALAPLSRLLRFTLNDGSSTRVCSVLIPTRAGVPAPGETVTLVMARGVPERAIVAKLYI